MSEEVKKSSKKNKTSTLPIILTSLVLIIVVSIFILWIIHVDKVVSTLYKSVEYPLISLEISNESYFSASTVDIYLESDNEFFSFDLGDVIFIKSNEETSKLQINYFNKGKTEEAIVFVGKKDLKPLTKQFTEKFNQNISFKNTDSVKSD